MQFKRDETIEPLPHYLFLNGLVRWPLRRELKKESDAKLRSLVENTVVATGEEEKWFRNSKEFRSLSIPDQLSQVREIRRRQRLFNGSNGFDSIVVKGFEFSDLIREVEEEEEANLKVPEAIVDVPPVSRL